ncbi:sulfite exporter TauE/SafE family protein [Chakrabartia godavariana]|nr:sulfite exporter TauE/SafE family protein [Chakrabartia godavariana]
MVWLTPAFFATALLYASVGFGGGSTYNALLALAGVDYRVLPAVALTCNILVVIGGTWRFHKAGLMPWKRALPLVVISAPFAWAGGLTPIKETHFLALLAASLLVAGVALLFQREVPVPSPLRLDQPQADQVSLPSRLREGLGEGLIDRKATLADLLTGAGVGYLAGLVGIGGGIFLAPYLHVTRWAGSKAIAATASLFILVNSIAGLAGQLLKLGSTGALPDVAAYWPLALAVIVGGQIGSFAGTKVLSPTLVKRATGVLILYVAGQLVWKLVG